MSFRPCKVTKGEHHWCEGGARDSGRYSCAMCQTCLLTGILIIDEREARKRAEKAEACVAEKSAYVSALVAELLEIVRVHDGSHTKDCRAYGAGLRDNDLPEPSDAGLMCTCGATHKRDHARQMVLGLHSGSEKT